MAKRGLVWLRRDLRVIDNTALLQACEQYEQVIAIFISTPETWQRHDKAERQIALTYARLHELETQLAGLNIPLLYREVPYFSDVADQLAVDIRQHNIDSLYFNKEYEWDELRRDAKVVKQCQKVEIDCYAYDDQVISPPGRIMTQSGQPYKVFTPFKKAWLAWVLETNAHISFGQPKPCQPVNVKSGKLPAASSSIDLTDWPVLERQVKERLSQFVSEQVHQYKAKRDYPGIDGTSRVSAYLALGMLSPRQCIDAILKSYDTESLSRVMQDEGVATWVSELIWREFYKHILYHFPRVCRGRAFIPAAEYVPWRDSDTDFKAWCEGKTGVPIVDAAMRCLNQTGWMHNRLRMVVAQFLSKNLLLDWRRGEQYFMQQLFDGDFSANNGGWQWSASTGTDSAPYFRIFNPASQSERFDSDGAFIRQYCPELESLDSKRIHMPQGHGDYPKPIVDLKSSRAQAIEVFKQALKR